MPTARTVDQRYPARTSFIATAWAVLILAGCSSPAEPLTAEPLRGMPDPTAATAVPPETSPEVEPTDHAQIYVLMVAEANCTGAHLDKIVTTTFGTEARTVIRETDWPHLQGVVLPAYRSWGEALQRLQAAIRSHDWPPEIRPHAETQASEYDVAIEWALAYANAPTVEAFATQFYELPPGSGGSQMRNALGLPVGPADTTDYCFLAGMPQP